MTITLPDSTEHLDAQARRNAYLAKRRQARQVADQLDQDLYTLEWCQYPRWPDVIFGRPDRHLTPDHQRRIVATYAERFGVQPAVERCGTGSENWSTRATTVDGVTVIVAADALPRIPASLPETAEPAEPADGGDTPEPASEEPETATLPAIDDTDGQADEKPRRRRTRKTADKPEQEGEK